jgi:branched-chain amino acid transport system permease protein
MSVLGRAAKQEGEQDAATATAACNGAVLSSGGIVNSYLAFMLLGLGAGALYGAMAQGLVLAFKGSGVVNFSHGAATMFVAYTYSELRRTGKMPLLPIPNPLSLVEGVANRFFGGHLRLPNFPTFLSTGGPRSFLPALLLALLAGVMLGLVIHFLVFRPMRAAPPLAKVVAAVGIMIVLQSTATLRFGSDTRNVTSILPSSGFTFAGVVVPWDRLVLAGLSVLLAVALTMLYRFTRFGLATVASAENEKGASLLGYSPDLLAAANWVLAMVLAGLLGVLASPITTLNPVNFTLFVIPALAAALVAKFSSFFIAALAGLGLGMLDQLVQYLGTRPATNWLPRGSRELVPFLAIAITMMMRGDSLPTRGAIRAGRLPRAPSIRRPGLGAALLFVVGAVCLSFMQFDIRQAITTSLIGVMLALSLVVLTGFVGQISLAQMAIAGFSAFGLTVLSGRFGMPFPFSVLVAAIGSTMLGVLVGIPALRVRGVNLAVITLSLALVLDRMIFNNPTWTQKNHTPLQAASPKLFGIGLGPFDPYFFGDHKIPSPTFGVFVLVITSLVALGVMNLRRSTTGRRMLAVRSNEAAAAAAGVNVARVKLAAFALSSFVAGLGGALLAYQAGGRLSPQGFAALQSLNILAIAYLGGIASVGGAVVAGLTILGGVATVLFQKVVHIQPWQELAGGLGLILVAVMNPTGVAGALLERQTAFRRRRASTNGLAQPSDVDAETAVRRSGDGAARTATNCAHVDQMLTRDVPASSGLVR